MQFVARTPILRLVQVVRWWRARYPAIGRQLYRAIIIFLVVCTLGLATPLLCIVHCLYLAHQSQHMLHHHGHHHGSASVAGSLACDLHTGGAQNQPSPPDTLQPRPFYELLPTPLMPPLGLDSGYDLLPPPYNTLRPQTTIAPLQRPPIA